MNSIFEPVGFAEQSYNTQVPGGN